MSKKAKLYGSVFVRLDRETLEKLDALIAARDDGRRDKPTKSAIIRELIRGAEL